MITDLDVANLPAPTIIEELDAEVVLAEMLADFVARYPAYDVGALESDTVKKLLEVCAFRETLLRNRINNVARSDLLAFSTGTNLDHLGAFHDLTRMDGELDDRFQKRIILAIAGRSTGGTAPRYALVAMSADIRIKDVVVYVDDASPIVHVSVLSSLNGGSPYPEMLTAVRVAINDPAVKMTNDTIDVQGAVSQTINVAADIWLLPNTSMGTFDGLEQVLRDAWAAEAGLSFDLTIEWIQARLMRPGVYKAKATSPATAAIAPFYKAIALGTVTLTYKGRAI